jgi:hypothetical protein
MSEEEIRGELQNLKQQIALLQKEHAGARKYWTHWLLSTGLILVTLALTVFIGVFRESGLAAANWNGLGALVIMAIFMFVLGLHLWFWAVPSWMNRIANLP